MESFNKHNIADVQILSRLKLNKENIYIWDPKYTYDIRQSRSGPNNESWK